MCTLTPSNPITLAAGGTENLIVTINVPNDATPGTYNLKIKHRTQPETLFTPPRSL